METDAGATFLALNSCHQHCVSCLVGMVCSTLC